MLLPTTAYRRVPVPLTQRGTCLAVSSICAMFKGSASMSSKANDNVERLFFRAASTNDLDAIVALGKLLGCPTRP